MNPIEGIGFKKWCEKEKSEFNKGYWMQNAR